MHLRLLCTRVAEPWFVLFEVITLSVLWLSENDRIVIFVCVPELRIDAGL